MITTELKSHFLRLYQMAFSDDNFDQLELKMLYAFAKDRGISSQELDEVLLNPSHETEIPQEIETRVEYLYDLAVMILADGKIHDDEKVTLRKYCKNFEFINVDELTDYLLECAKKKMSKSQVINSIKA